MSPYPYNASGLTNKMGSAMKPFALNHSFPDTVRFSGTPFYSLSECLITMTRALRGTRLVTCGLDGREHLVPKLEVPRNLGLHERRKGRR